MRAVTVAAPILLLLVYFPKLISRPGSPGSQRFRPVGSQFERGHGFSTLIIRPLALGLRGDQSASLPLDGTHGPILSSSLWQPGASSALGIRSSPQFRASSSFTLPCPSIF